MLDAKTSFQMERQNQAAYFKWVRFMENSDKRYRRIFGIEHGVALSGSRAQRAMMWNRMVSQGVKKGFPDILILHPIITDTHFYPGAVIEGKAGKNKTTPEQEDILGILHAAGFATVVLRTVDEMIQFTKDYFAMEDLGASK